MIDEKKLIERFRKLKGSDSLANMFIKDAIKEIEKQPKIGEWIPCSERLPENDRYILLSFENLTIPMEGRYEEDEAGGAFYVGDDIESCVSQDIIVNAWQPLPEPYKE